MITLRQLRGQRNLGVGLAVGLAACAPSPGSIASTPTTGSDAVWQLPRPVAAVEAPSALAVTVHPAASEVGAIIINRGGNAVDAAVAIGFALAVVHPSAGNIGGGGFMVIRLANGATHALDYREKAPVGATRDMYLDAAGNPTEGSRTGHLAAGVPGSVAGLVAAHERFGRLPFDEVVGPAIRFARDGVVLDRHRAASLRRAAPRLAQFEGSRRHFLEANGEAAQEGTLFVQPALARTLQAIAAHGRAGFYRGWVADSIVAEMERGGGLITHEDLRDYRAVWRDPVTFTYREHRVYTMPPPSSGIALAEILNMLEQGGSLPAFGTSDHAHLWAEVLRRAFLDRNTFFGDPTFVDIPTTRLLSKEYAAERAADIRPHEATPSSSVSPGFEESQETTHYSVVDPAGNAVAVTTTINGGYGSGVAVSGAGFLLNNEMDDFAVAPNRPNMYGLVQGDANAIEPRKRMLSSMIPTIVLDPTGELFLVLGTPGGPTIISTVAQVITNVLDHGMTLAEAVAAPRVHHQGIPDVLRFERGGLARATVARLRAMGHRVDERPGYSGEVAAILRIPGGWVGVADPRSGGGAAGF